MKVLLDAVTGAQHDVHEIFLAGQEVPPLFAARVDKDRQQSFQRGRHCCDQFVSSIIFQIAVVLFFFRVWIYSAGHNYAQHSASDAWAGTLSFEIAAALIIMFIATLFDTQEPRPASPMVDS